MSDQQPTATLSTFDVLEATPCVVTIHRVNGGLAFGWCEVCADEHIIDRLGFEKGKGPWRRAEMENYDGPDPSVECAWTPCENRLRRSEASTAQWCSKVHRRWSEAEQSGRGEARDD